MSQGTQVRYAGPATGAERGLAEVLAEVVRVERVSVEATSSRTWVPTRW